MGGIEEGKARRGGGLALPNNVLEPAPALSHQLREPLDQFALARRRWWGLEGGGWRDRRRQGGEVELVAETVEGGSERGGQARGQDGQAVVEAAADEAVEGVERVVEEQEAETEPRVTRLPHPQ